MTRILIGVMGPGEHATESEKNTAFALGQEIARQGWVLLTGGRATGVMEAASQGARTAGGLVVGILPSEDTTNLSEAVDIPVVTGIGHARNVINVLSSRVVVACGLGAGTLSEIAIALKLQKPLVLMHIPEDMQRHLRQLAKAPVFTADTVAMAIVKIWQLLD